MRVPIALILVASAAMPALAMQLHSRDLPRHRPLPAAQVYRGFGCHGGNTSPQLSWTGVPAGTRSFAVTVYDPDAPTGSGWWHWVVYDIPATVRALPAGAGAAGGTRLPAGARQARNDFGRRAYGGACPPAGAPAHHYRFTVYALRVAKLPVPADASPALVGYLIHADRLGRARRVLRYGR